MADGGRHQHHVPVRQLEPLDRPVERGQGGVLGVHHALRLAGGAGGEDHLVDPVRVGAGQAPAPLARLPRRVRQHAERLHAGARRAGLVMVVNDLRKPIPIKHAVDGFGFRLCNHIKISIVIVPNVLVIEHRQRGCRAFGWVGVAHVPV